MADPEPAASPESEAQGDQIQLPVELHISETIKTTFVMDFIIQHTQHEFFIYLFETLPPLLLGSPEERREQIQSAGAGIRAECVGRLAITPSRIPDLIRVLQDSWIKYQRNLSTLTNEDDQEVS